MAIFTYKVEPHSSPPHKRQTAIFKTGNGNDRWLNIFDFLALPSQHARRMTRPNNPLYLARETQNMAKYAGSDGQFFQKVAAVGMCMVTVLTGMHLLNELYKELYRGDRRQGRGR